MDLDKITNWTTVDVGFVDEDPILKQEDSVSETSSACPSVFKPNAVSETEDETQPIDSVDFQGPSEEVEENLERDIRAGSVHDAESVRSSEFANRCRR